MIDPDNKTRAALAKERKKFERWMHRKWGGIPLDTIALLRHSFEYKDSSAQTAWEVWLKFTVLSDKPGNESGDGHGA